MGFTKEQKKLWHQISGVDPVALTGCCSRCGPVPVIPYTYISKGGDAVMHYKCKTKQVEAHGIRAEHDWTCDHCGFRATRARTLKVSADGQAVHCRNCISDGFV